MTKDEVMALAFEAGLVFRDKAEEFYSDYCDGIRLDHLERFAALVAAAEREECAKMCDELGRLWPDGDGWQKFCADVIRTRSEK